TSTGIVRVDLERALEALGGVAVLAGAEIGLAQKRVYLSAARPHARGLLEVLDRGRVLAGAQRDLALAHDRLGVLWIQVQGLLEVAQRAVDVAVAQVALAQLGKERGLLGVLRATRGVLVLVLVAAERVHEGVAELVGGIR